jgi:transposase
MTRRRYELSEEEWDKISPFLPKGKSGPGLRGRPRTENRKVLNGLIWLLRSGAPWRDIPERYGPYTTIYTRFRELMACGSLLEIVSSLQLDFELAELLEDEEWEIDSTIIRAQVSAAGAPEKKRKPASG